ncbi:MAG: M90 family metallopeptidase [Polyangiaceae bacterium]
MGWWKKLRRAHLTDTAVPREWTAILERNVSIVARLDASEHKTLEDAVRIFVAEKNFEGCGGLEMNDEIRVTIAGQACTLLLHLDDADVFPTVESVLVYPSAYRAPVETRPGGIVVDDVARAGESWQDGTLVLAWDEVLRAAHDPRHNVVLHEFAHALDQEDGSADGAPRLPARAMYGPWARVLGAEYEQLTRDIQEGHRTSLDPYGATNPAEFFAVVTEAFFGQPVALRSKHPALYEQLRGFYRQDPASRSLRAP